MKKGCVVAIALIVFMLSVSAVSAGFLDGLLGGNSNSSNSNKNNIPMETKEIDGLIRISAPSGSNFLDDGQTKYGPSYKNYGDHSVEIQYIIYAPYEFNSSFPSQNQFFEQDGNLTVYQDTGLSTLYYVDRHVNGSTVALMGTNLDLLKEMANSVEIL